MTTVAEIIVTLQKESAEKLREIERLKRLLAVFPDLQRDIGRWEKVVYSSKAVNELVTDYDRRLNCGCCPDSPLEIWPYLETPDGRIYSNPSCFVVGERHWISGAISQPGWKDKLRSAKIPEAIIERIAQGFRDDSEKRKQIAEDTSYEE